jgi:hypothetical protein
MQKDRVHKGTAAHLLPHCLQMLLQRANCTRALPSTCLLLLCSPLRLSEGHLKVCL